MQTDISPERPITFNEAADLLPKRARPSYSTWWRWWKKGVKGIRLSTVVVGGRRYTTARAVQDWITKVTAAADGTPAPVRSPARRERDIVRAEAEMKETLGRAHRTAKDGGGGT